MMETAKPKLEVLDALRGFCALMVVALHFCENYSNSLIPHGCLPVEYFFILTGFMMVYAYDGRWSQGLTFGSFFKRRVLRLQPLIVIGSLIGACCYFIAPQQYAPIVPRGETLGLGQLGLLFLWCSTLVPQPSLFGWKLMHTLQGPLWTMLVDATSGEATSPSLQQKEAGFLCSEATTMYPSRGVSEILERGKRVLGSVTSAVVVIRDVKRAQSLHFHLHSDLDFACNCALAALNCNVSRGL